MLLLNRHIIRAINKIYYLHRRNLEDLKVISLGGAMKIILCLLFFSLNWAAQAQPQKDIFIPMMDRNELRIDPDMDTLEDGVDYFFNIQLEKGYKITQSFFDKGLATLYDSFLVVRPKSTIPKGNEISALRFIITNKNKTRILLMKEFVIKNDGSRYPMLSKPKTNIVTLSSDFAIERNKTYSPKDFIQHPVISLWATEDSDTSTKINALRMTIVRKKKQKNMRVLNDTLSLEMLNELKRIKRNTTVFLCLEVPMPRNRTKNIWSRFYIKE